MNIHEQNNNRIAHTLKIIGIVVPILVIVIGAYINLMVKLTAIEERIIAYNDKIIKIELRLDKLESKFDKNK